MKRRYLGELYEQTGTTPRAEALLVVEWEQWVHLAKEVGWAEIVDLVKTLHSSGANPRLGRFGDSDPLSAKYEGKHVVHF